MESSAQQVLAHLAEVTADPSKPLDVRLLQALENHLQGELLQRTLVHGDTNSVKMRPKPEYVVSSDPTYAKPLYYKLPLSSKPFSKILRRQQALSLA